MILFEICNRNESAPAYQEMMVGNLDRQYSFLLSAVQAAVSTRKLHLSHTLIKALNYHAITCLHVSAGEYRPCQVHVGQGEGRFDPPEHYVVPALMDEFINEVNRNFALVDPLYLAAYTLWRLNYIHPFVNGNGRTARALCYYVICLCAGGLLAGTRILPELIQLRRADYVAALKHADTSALAGLVDLAPLQNLLAELLAEQAASAGLVAEVAQPQS